MRITLRAENSADIFDVENLIEEAFRRIEISDKREHLIVRELRKSGVLYLSKVAVCDGILAGHIAISPVSNDLKRSGWFGLGPVSVHPSFQRKGLGSALILDALKEIKQKGASGCVVLGEPSYYSKFGFRFFENAVLPGVPRQYFQCLSFDAEEARGVFKYHSSFYV